MTGICTIDKYHCTYHHVFFQTYSGPFADEEEESFPVSAKKFAGILCKQIMNYADKNCCRSLPRARVNEDINIFYFHVSFNLFVLIISLFVHYLPGQDNENSSRRESPIVLVQGQGSPINSELTNSLSSSSSGSATDIGSYKGRTGRCHTKKRLPLKTNKKHQKTVPSST